MSKSVEFHLIIQRLTMDVDTYGLCEVCLKGIAKTDEVAQIQGAADFVSSDKPIRVVLSEDN